MEEKKVEELVVKMEGRGGAWPAKGGSKMALWAAAVCRKQRRRRRNNEREKNVKRGVYIYKGLEIITNLPSTNGTCVPCQLKLLRPQKVGSASRQKRDAEIKAASRSKDARFAFARKDKKAWFRIDLT